MLIFNQFLQHLKEFCVITFHVFNRKVGSGFIGVDFSKGSGFVKVFCLFVACEVLTNQASVDF